MDLQRIAIALPLLVIALIALDWARHVASGRR